MKAIAYSILVSCIACQTARNPYVASDVTVDELRYHVSYLASDSLQGRAAGSPGNDAAADYLAAEFKSYGLLPSGDSSYFQPFEVITGVGAGPMNSLVANGKSFILNEDFRPLAFSANRKCVSRVIYAGYGISDPALQHDDYAHSAVAGRIVLILKNSPEGDNPHSAYGFQSSLRRKVALAEENNAAGVMVVSGAEAEDELEDLKYEQGGGHYAIPVVSVTRETATAIMGIDDQTLIGWQRVSNSHKSVPEGISVDSVILSTDVALERRMTRNVAALLKGPDNNDEVVVIGAHFDHLGMGGSGSLYRGEPAVHNGADDNASGTAMVLELAQYFSHHPTRRSLMFVGFSAEEMGLLGSKYFVEHPPIETSRIVTMFNFDMVGRLKDSALIVYGMGTSPGFRDVMTQSNDSNRLRLTLKEDGQGPSDYAEFYKKDIPIIAFFTNLHEDYHRPSDDADKINYEGELQIAHLAIRAIERIANDSARPAFTRVRDESSRPMRGFRVSLSVVPNYAFDGEGMKIDDVNPGGPAAKAGLLKGDIIIRFGGKVIRDIYDYTYALGEFNPGDKVEVVVRRGTSEVKVNVDLTKSKRSP